MPRSSNRFFSFNFLHHTHYVFLYDSLRATCLIHLILLEPMDLLICDVQY